MHNPVQNTTHTHTQPTHIYLVYTWIYMYMGMMININVNKNNMVLHELCHQLIKVRQNCTLPEVTVVEVLRLFIKIPLNMPTNCFLIFLSPTA